MTHEVFSGSHVPGVEVRSFELDGEELRAVLHYKQEYVLMDMMSEGVIDAVIRSWLRGLVLRYRLGRP